MHSNLDLNTVQEHGVCRKLDEEKLSSFRSSFSTNRSYILALQERNTPSSVWARKSIQLFGRSALLLGLLSGPFQKAHHTLAKYLMRPHTNITLFTSKSCLWQHIGPSHSHHTTWSRLDLKWHYITGNEAVHSAKLPRRDWKSHLTKFVKCAKYIKR